MSRLQTGLVRKASRETNVRVLRRAASQLISLYPRSAGLSSVKYLFPRESYCICQLALRFQTYDYRTYPGLEIGTTPSEPRRPRSTVSAGCRPYIPKSEAHIFIRPIYRPVWCVRRAVKLALQIYWDDVPSK